MITVPQREIVADAVEALVDVPKREGDLLPLTLDEAILADRLARQLAKN